MPEKPLQLAIVGYGRMGRLIEQLAPEYECAVALRLDEFNNAGGSGLTHANFGGIDVAIEFSTPETVLPNVRGLCSLGVNAVVGATGWSAHLDEVRSAVNEAGTGFVWSPNFSIGVNAFFRLVAEAARLMAAAPGYEAWGWEVHHSAKKDAPSGTLLQLVAEMKKSGYQQPVDVSSSRAGAHPGTHEIGFDSPADTITLRHSARSREGFARGALQAARWISGRKGFYEFSEILFGGGK